MAELEANIKLILESLERRNAIEDLLNFAPLVGPSALISNNLNWLNKFNEGKTQYYEKNYGYSAYTFKELDKELPSHGRFTSSAKINETFCWLHVGKYEEFIHEYEDLLRQDKVYGFVLWNLAIAYYRINKLDDAETCMKKWINSSHPQLLNKGYLSISLLEFKNDKVVEAVESFKKIWARDEDLCIHIIKKFVDKELAKDLLKLKLDKEIDKNDYKIISKNEVIVTLRSLLIAKAPEKYSQLAQQFSDFEYQHEYITALEKFSDGDIDGALIIIDNILKIQDSVYPLYWAKLACLVAKREWEKSIELIEDQLNDRNIPGGVLWNIACAYFNLESFKLAFDAIRKCTEKEYRTSAPAWLIQGLLAHLCGFNNSCYRSLREVKHLSPRYLINYRDILGQIGFNIDTISTENKSQVFVKEFAKDSLGFKVEEVPKGENLQIIAKNEVIVALQSLLIPKAPEKYPPVMHQLSEYEYQYGYIAALEKFSDGNIDDALIIIDNILKSSGGVHSLYWAKSACLAAKREWEKSIELIKDQLDDPSVTGGVFWNLTCAYFNLNSFKLALETIRKCTEKEYKSSASAWLAQSLLAHLCGFNDLRDKSLEEVKNISPSHLVHYFDILKQIGFNINIISSENNSHELVIKDENASIINEEIIRNVRELLKQRKGVQAAEAFSKLASNSFNDMPEIKEITFEPIIFLTCPKSLSDDREIFLSGVAAYQRKAYEEALKKFEEIYIKNQENYPVANNLGALYIIAERYSQAIEILDRIIKNRDYGGANAIRNIICAYIRSNKIDEAFQFYNKLIAVSGNEFSDFLRMAYVANLLNKKEDTATALFNACSSNLIKPSIYLKCAAIKACLDVKDYDRAIVLVNYFVEEKPLPYTIAGTTRPIKPAIECSDIFLMHRQYQKFRLSKDSRAALAYFEKVYEARENDYIKQPSYRTADSLFHSCLFYSKSLIWSNENYKLDELLKYTLKILEDNTHYYKKNDLAKRYYKLTQIYMECKYYFAALESCQKSLAKDRDNKFLSKLKDKIERQIDEIPQTSRDAIKELAELSIIIEQGKADDFMANIPRINQLMSIISNDFPESKKITKPMENAFRDLINLDNIEITEKKKEIIRLKESIKDLEPKLNSNIPKVFITTFLPLFKGFKKTLDEYQAKSIIPEFELTLETNCYYYENEATLVYKLKNSGNADIQELSIKIESNLPNKWIPIFEEKEFGKIKKDGLLWVDWPIHLESISNGDSQIRPKAILSYTGGSLKGNSISQIIDSQSAELMPFLDLNVNYPVVALRPEENNKLFGRGNLLRTLKNSFTKSGQTRIPFLEGVRKVGKTSILYFLAHRLADVYLPVYINLDTTWTNLYQLFAKEIQNKINIWANQEVDINSQVKDEYDFERFLLRATREANMKHIILLLDEFHVIIERIEDGTLPKEILGDLRDLYMNPQKKVSVAFADWYRLDELKSRIPAQLWTDFACERVSFLNELDCHEAVVSPSQGSSLRFERDTISRIYYWTNGYPWHIQWICSELINHLNVQKRYVAIPQDIDLIATRLLCQDRFFNEGVCRPERLAQDDQRLIYNILEILRNSHRDVASWFSRELVLGIKINFDTNLELNKLLRLEILHEHGNELRFCSPLHAMWFEAKMLKGIDIYNKNNEKEKNDVKEVLAIPVDPEHDIYKKCEKIRDLKIQIRLALNNKNQIFNNVEMPDEWKNASIRVRSKETWDTFLKSLRNLFIEDMRSKLNTWEDKELYPQLFKELHSIRLRRNYIEHILSIEGQKEEEDCCRKDIHKVFPLSENDWLMLQLRALDRIIESLEITLGQIAKI